MNYLLSRLIRTPFVTLILSTWLIPGHAQTQAAAVQDSVSSPSVASIHASIDQQVWRPFKRAFEAMDGAALNALYAPEVVRITPDGIDTENRFRTTNLTRFDTAIKAGATTQLDFWLDSRRSNSHLSYEVGFFRVTNTSRDGASQYFYGQFHIILKRIEGQWLITQDWDTDQIGRRTIDAELFGTQPPMF